MERTIYNHIFSENRDTEGVTHRIVVQEMYFSQLEYLMQNTKRIRPKRWNAERLTLVGKYKPSMSYGSHDIIQINFFTNPKGTYFFEIHKTDEHHLPVVRYRKWLLDIVPTV